MFVGFCEGCDQNGGRVSTSDKSGHICIRWLKSGFSIALWVLVCYEKYGTLSDFYGLYVLHDPIVNCLYNNTMPFGCELH